MVDHEVEQTLREIRERVRAAAPPQPHAPGPLAPALEAASAHAGAIAHAADAPGPTPARGGTFEALARMEANLATTERAWSRLPPVLSYRRGALARFELAVKRLVKRALHWFTWEQVNFNSAAHHALRDALAALSTQERRLAETRAELDAVRRRAAEAEARVEAERARLEGAAVRRHDELRAELERARVEQRAELERARAELRAESRAELERTRAELNAELERARVELSAELERLRAELPELRTGLRDELHTGLHAELRAELADALGGELRERVGYLTEEQRVCFRQLSLEATEAAVAHDRARRLVEARLEELEKAVNREP
jgi:hypothetical protein